MTREAEESHNQGNEIWTVSSTRILFSDQTGTFGHCLLRRLLSAKRFSIGFRACTDAAA